MVFAVHSTIPRDSVDGDGASKFLSERVLNSNCCHESPCSSRIRGITPFDIHLQPLLSSSDPEHLES